ncbi:MAG: DUF3604 domain-containing protein [Gammaproteobacteria bacterium]|nr:DUF3604 domain-containing protein [Gammaproteobacteria bacterium]
MPGIMNKLTMAHAVALSLSTMTAAAGDDATASGANYSPYAGRDYPTNVYFGETHIHSALSTDAGGGGTKLMPRDLYRFARGEQVMSNTGQPVQLARPLDFMCVTEHTDGMGAITDIINGVPSIMADEQGRQYHEAFNAGGDKAKAASLDIIKQFGQGTLSKALIYQPGNPAYTRTWQDLVQAAEEYNEPHRFTAMIAYEWTAMVKGNNLHRNVIFRDGPERTLQVVPFTMTPPMGSPNPRELWKWLQNYEDKTGGDVIAIPHNGNLSNGMIFPMQDDFADGAAFDEAYAETRQKWERLYEIGQTKGDTETHPKLSPDDEFADYESWDWANLDMTDVKTDDMLPGEYARSGLKRGLELEHRLGVNPFKVGFVGGSDIHTALVTNDDDNFFGAFAWMEPKPERAMMLAKENKDLGVGYKGWQYASPGPTAVWATSNTRAAIFDAMERREVYATTGPRIRVRFFAGYDFDQDDVRQRDIATAGYRKGVPMGADLQAAPAGKVPGFLVAALRDPMGANLDRIQIVKGWIDATGATHEKVYDVAWSGSRSPGADGKLPPVGDTVDLSVPTWTNTIGAAELSAMWADPDFDPAQKAFYYARVLEIPTPRWTAYDRARYKLELPAEVTLKTQERAYTSPIWYQAK